MIPKVIHYCWFGGKPLPELARKCIESWRKYCPGYEIKEWNESNFDINCCDYVREAFEAQKWAFVSDYARFWILYNYGGIYFDTDVELLKPLEPIIERGPFMGFESISEEAETQGWRIAVNPGLGLGTKPGLDLYEEILAYYNKMHFVNTDGSLNIVTVVTHVTNILRKYGLQDNNVIQYVAEVYIYPSDYFSPKSFKTGEINLTENTYSIHHYDMSWLKGDNKFFKELEWKYIQRFGTGVGRRLFAIRCAPYRICKYCKANGWSGLFGYITSRIRKYGLHNK